MVFMQFYDKIPVNYQDLAVPVYFLPVYIWYLCLDFYCNIWCFRA